MRSSGAQSTGREGVQRRADDARSCTAGDASPRDAHARGPIVRMHGTRRIAEQIYGMWTRIYAAISRKSANQRRASIHVFCIENPDACASAAIVAASCLYELSV